MEKNTKSLYLTYGITISLISIVLELITRFTHQYSNIWLGIIGIVVFLGGIILCCLAYSKQMAGQVTFGNLFAIGFKATSVFVVITIIWFLIEAFVIFPDLKAETINFIREYMLKKGISEDLIDAQLKIRTDHFYLIEIGSKLLGGALVGAIAALIGAAVSKKVPKNADPFQQ